MEPDDRKALYRAISLAEENNAILKKMRSAQKTSRMFRTIYWVIGLALTAAAYYAVKPYLTTLENTYASVKNSAADVQGMVSQFKSQ